MRKGFTILEMLVASLLLAMMMMILTMLFNQSSIAWRTANADMSNFDKVLDKMSQVRVASDAAYPWGGKGLAIQGVWKDDGTLNVRGVDTSGKIGSGTTSFGVSVLGIGSWTSLKSEDLPGVALTGASSDGSGGGAGKVNAYVINVMSSGPDREMNTYDDIWSYPDDFE